MRKQRILRLLIWIHRHLQHSCQTDKHFADHCHPHCWTDLALLHHSHRARQVHRVRLHHLPKQLATRSHAHPLGIKRLEHAVHTRQRAHLPSADHSSRRMLSCHHALHPVWRAAERTGRNANPGHHRQLRLLHQHRHQRIAKSSLRVSRLLLCPHRAGRLHRALPHHRRRHLHRQKEKNASYGGGSSGQGII